MNGRFSYAYSFAYVGRQKTTDIQKLKKKDVIFMLDYYYRCLNEKAKDYSYETFINDYKISIAENMFFTIRLINRGINDFRMRDKAIRAFETFILENRSTHDIYWI